MKAIRAHHFPMVDEVYANDKCFELAEMDFMAQSYSGLHRYQILRIIREDSFGGRAIWEWERDMGPAAAHGADQFIIPGTGYTGEYFLGRRVPLEMETVAHLQDCADALREVGKADRAFDRTAFVKLAEETLVKKARRASGTTHFPVTEYGRKA